MHIHTGELRQRVVRFDVGERTVQGLGQLRVRRKLAGEWRGPGRGGRVHMKMAIAWWWRWNRSDQEMTEDGVWDGWSPT